MTKKNKSKKAVTVLVNFILDKSGSMASLVSDTVGGFNSYIEQLRKAKGVSHLFSLTLFDTNCENRHVALPLAELPALDASTYKPDGWTALYDAIGTTVRSVDGSKAKFDKVITVILTDGHENSSREFTQRQIQDLIAAKEKLGNWTFIYLGATADAWDVGVNLGISVANTVRYDPLKTRKMYATVGTASASMSMDSAFSSKDMFKTARIPMRALRAAGLSRRLPKR